MRELLLIGIPLVIAGGILANFYEIIEFPAVFLLDLPPRFDVIKSLGLNLLLLAGFYYLQDHCKKDWKSFKVLGTFGHVSLTVFVLQLLIIPRILRMFYDFLYSFSNYSVFVFITLFFCFYYVLGVLNQKFDRKLSLEGLMRKLL